MAPSIPSIGLRLRALAALVAFVGSLTLPLLSLGHFVLEDDRACAPVQLTTTGDDAELEPLRPAPPQNHCVVCHWLRAVGGSRTTGVTTCDVWLEPSAPTVIVAPAWHATLALTDRPSRAPPALLG